MRPSDSEGTRDFSVGFNKGGSLASFISLPIPPVSMQCGTHPSRTRFGLVRLSKSRYSYLYAAERHTANRTIY